MHEADPNHPIWLVQAPRGTVEALKRYDAGWDVGGIDIYPGSYPPGRHSEEANKDITVVGDFTRMMRAAAGAKPFWMTLHPLPRPAKAMCDRGIGVRRAAQGRGKDGSFTDWFAPYDVHVYRFKKQSSP